MKTCLNCEDNGLWSRLIDRGDHYFCVVCGQREEKQEPAYKSVYYPFPTSC